MREESAIVAQINHRVLLQPGKICKPLALMNAKYYMRINDRNRLVPVNFRSCILPHYVDLCPLKEGCNLLNEEEIKCSDLHFSHNNCLQFKRRFYTRITIKYEVEISRRCIKISILNKDISGIYADCAVASAIFSTSRFWLNEIICIRRNPRESSDVDKVCKSANYE